MPRSALTKLRKIVDFSLNSVYLYCPTIAMCIVRSCMAGNHWILVQEFLRHRAHGISVTIWMGMPSRSKQPVTARSSHAVIIEINQLLIVIEVSLLQIAGIKSHFMWSLILSCDWMVFTNLLNERLMKPGFNSEYVLHWLTSTLISETENRRIWLQRWIEQLREQFSLASSIISLCLEVK